jgi:predicted RNase H-like HicB family nuclease
MAGGKGWTFAESERVFVFPNVIAMAKPRHLDCNPAFRVRSHPTSLQCFVIPCAQLAWTYDGFLYNLFVMRIEVEQEVDGRWIAEIPELPGTLVYGASKEESLAKVQALALRVLADRLEHGEKVPELVQVFQVAA